MNHVKKFTLFILLGFVLTGCTHSVASEPDLIGEISAEQLLAQYPAFQAEYKAYQPSQEELAAVAELQKDTLVVLFGTWCHDSQREVPRLLKTFDLSGLEVPKLTLVAVDRKKSDPQGLAKQYGLRYTPTFILLNDGKELGRVIERPKTGLTQDLKALAAATR